MEIESTTLDLKIGDGITTVLQRNLTVFFFELQGWFVSAEHDRYAALSTGGGASGNLSVGCDAQVVMNL